MQFSCIVYIMKLKNKLKIEVFLPSETKEKLRLYAESQGLTMAAVIKIVLNAFLSKK